MIELVNISIVLNNTISNFCRSFWANVAAILQTIERFCITKNRAKDPGFSELISEL